MEAPRKRRKLSFNVPKQPVPIQWESPFNKEGKVTLLCHFVTLSTVHYWLPSTIDVAKEKKPQTC